MNFAYITANVSRVMVCLRHAIFTLFFFYNTNTNSHKCLMFIKFNNHRRKQALRATIISVHHRRGIFAKYTDVKEAHYGGCLRRKTGSLANFGRIYMIKRVYLGVFAEQNGCGNSTAMLPRQRTLCQNTESTPIIRTDSHINT